MPRLRPLFPLGRLLPPERRKGLSKEHLLGENQTECTHLRNTEPGLSVELCRASRLACLGLPVISNRNTDLSWEESLFFTMVHMSIGKSRNKLRGSFLSLSNHVKVSAC